jgi:ABC-type uncharacterized transport system permease subunit
MDSRVYLLLTLACYSVGALHVVVHALTRRRLLTQWTVTATLVGFALHTAALSQRWTEARHFPVVGLHDGTAVLAWTTVLVFLATYVRTRVDALGLLVYPAAFALVLVSNFAPVAETSERNAIHSLFLPIHATLAFFGYAALFVAFAMGVLYLIQERELKSRSPRAFYYLIPSLERCDTISGRSVAVGFSLLTLAIATGMLFSQATRGRYWSWDAKELSASCAWILYVVLIVARWRAGWGGRRAAYLGIAGFVAVVAVFFYVTGLGGVVRAAP